MQVAGALVGAGEPRADHDLAGAGRERQGDVARVPYAAVGPDVLAELAGRGGAVQDGGELRPPDAVIMRVVHMAPGPTPTLTTSAPAATRSRTPSAVTTLPATTGTCGSSERTAFSASSILAWWPCAVSTTSASTPASSSARGLGADVAVDADGGGDAQPARVVQGRGVDGGAQCALAGEQPHQDAVPRRPGRTGGGRRTGRRSRRATVRARQVRGVQHDELGATSRPRAA